MRRHESHGAPDVLSEDLPLEELRRAVFTGDAGLARDAALRLLGQRDYPAKEGDLERALTDPALPREVHVTAALELGRLGAQRTLDLLLEALDDSEPLVVRAALEALGPIGDRRALRRIVELLERTERRDVAATARWSAAWIAYRLDEPGFEIPRPGTQPLDQEHAVSIESGPADPGEVEKALRDLAAEYLRITPSRRGATALVCAGRRLLFLWDEGFLSELPQKLGQGRAVAGLLALLETYPIDHYIGYRLALVQPGPPNGFDLLLVTTKGEPIYAGQGTLSGGEAAFTLGTVTGAIAEAVEIRGAYAGNGLRLDRALSGTEPPMARVPPRVRRPQPE